MNNGYILSSFFFLILQNIYGLNGKQITGCCRYAIIFHELESSLIQDKECMPSNALVFIQSYKDKILGLKVINMLGLA